jgi:hypothetical protein
MNKQGHASVSIQLLFKVNSCSKLSILILYDIILYNHTTQDLYEAILSQQAIRSAICIERNLITRLCYTGLLNLIYHENKLRVTLVQQRKSIVDLNEQ